MPKAALGQDVSNNILLVHAELSTAIELGHDLVKELAYLSETSAYVPDSNLTIETNALPDFSPNASYGYQLVASGVLGGIPLVITSQHDTTFWPPFISERFAPRNHYGNWHLGCRL
ncbi:MAG: hypothetical protein ACSHX0_13525 [Akkermansiaceae bacterium]